MDNYFDCVFVFVYNVCMKNKRKQLSMKRITMLSANYCISLGEKKGTEVLPVLMDFLKYMWEHKEDSDLYRVPFLTKKGSKN